MQVRTDQKNEKITDMASSLASESLPIPPKVSVSPTVSKRLRLGDREVKNESTRAMLPPSPTTSGSHRRFKPWLSGMRDWLGLGHRLVHRVELCG